MSLLQQNSPDLDDAARGEDFTRGSSHIVWAAAIAAIVVSIAVAAYALVTKEMPAATGQVARATVHFVHHESSGMDAAGNPMPKEPFDQVLVFSHIQVHNQSKNPLFVRQIMTNVTLDDGIHTSYAAIPHDYERLFQANPDLAVLHGTPLPGDITIAPGQTLEGDIVAAFRLTQAEWTANKGMNYTVSLQYQPDLILPGPMRVNVQ
ncbi:hypothetical protein [Terracidiphilus sp.]|uniref:hypothetical protein n=1 Tax=Terracidiphilus sp. TaxID=1964191 RepID=UPI003C2548FD